MVQAALFIRRTLAERRRAGVLPALFCGNEDLRYGVDAGAPNLNTMLAENGNVVVGIRPEL